MPTINVDKTDGCMMYLSKDSLKTEIVSAKSSEMNVLIPDASGQFVSVHLLYAVLTASIISVAGVSC